MGCWRESKNCRPNRRIGYYTTQFQFTARKCEKLFLNNKSYCLKALRSFKVTLSVDPKFHPKIIGRKGTVISQIRKDYDVNVQFPDKSDEQQVCICQ